MRQWLIAVALALPLAAREATAQQRTRFASGGRAHIDTSFTFDRRGTVTVTAGPGDVIVVGSSSDQIRVRGSSENDNIRMDATSSRVNLELVSGFRRSSDIRFEISVPYGVRVIAHTQGGDVHIRGTRGPVEVRTQNGDVDLDEVTELLDVNTLSGDIKAHGITADVDIGSTAGRVELTDVRGNVSAQTTSGDIEIRRTTSKLVRAKTTSGDVTYDGVIDPAGRYDLSSHSGDVDVAIPADASAQLTVSTWNGGVDSDFPITLKAGEHVLGSSNAKRFTFAIGGAAARITTETFSGDIRIRRTR
jgi:DUF4097 and DUF4098 domain-containing protein YvlB